MLKCEVEARRVYGKTLFYPLNDTAKKLTVLCNCTTLTALQLKRVKDTGIDVNVYYINNGNAMLAPNQF